MATTDLWMFRDSTWRGHALVGFNVETLDGEDIGKVDEASENERGNCLIVDTGTDDRRDEVAYRAELGGYYDSR